MSQTNGTGPTTTLSLADLERAMLDVGLLAQPKTWTVIDPQGRVYRGTVAEVTPVLLAQHPLLASTQFPYTRDPGVQS